MKNLNSKIKMAKDHIFEVLNKMDRTGKNAELYKAKFDSMTDREFINFCKTGVVRLFTTLSEVEPKLSDLIGVCEDLGVPVRERMTIPFYETSAKVTADKKVMIVPIMFKRMEQFITKENSSSSDLSVRDKTNQVMGESKAAMLADMEVAMLVAKGYNKLIQSYMTVRGDHDTSKHEVYASIIETGSANLPSSIHDNEDKVSLQLLYHHYLGMGIETDLLYDID